MRSAIGARAARGVLAASPLPTAPSPSPLIGVGFCAGGGCRAVTAAAGRGRGSGGSTSSPSKSGGGRGRGRGGSSKPPANKQQQDRPTPAATTAAADAESDDDDNSPPSAADAERFERVAAALVARMEAMGELDGPDNFDLDGGDSGESSGGATALAGVSDAELLRSQPKPARASVASPPPPSKTAGAPFLANALALAEAAEQADAAERALQEELASRASEPLTLATALPRAKRRAKRVPDESLPKLAIVGRPNVGKSAMFNRIAGRALAVVYDTPGVTRDRLYARAFWGDREFLLVDTGGLMSDAARLPAGKEREAGMRAISAEGLPRAIEAQAAAGVAEADAVLLVVDGQAGPQPGDEEILAWLRRAHPTKPVTLAVNKCESPAKADLQAAEFWPLAGGGKGGGGVPHAVSAISGAGTGEVLDAAVGTLPPPYAPPEEEAEAKPLAVAIIGRPNVGKSSLLNAVVGEERAIVCDLSGTTRDAVDTRLTLPSGDEVILIDTAGMRKRAKVASGSESAFEQLSVDRALRAVSRADVVVAVVDASEGVTQQDFRLTELAAAHGKALVVVANKWDRADRERWPSSDAFAADVRAQLRHAAWARVVCTVATRGRRVPEVLEAALEAGKQHATRVSTATLNLVVREAAAWKRPPPVKGGGGRSGRVYYATQAGTKPPTFVLFVNDPALFPDDYRRYIERALRDSIGFPGTPLRLLWRGKDSGNNSERAPARGGGGGGRGGGGRGGGGGGRGRASR